MSGGKSDDIYLRLSVPSEKERTMFNPRRNRSCGQSIFVVLVMLTLLYGGYLYFDLKKNFEDTRDRALRYQQQQESLTGQLQVVYEHRLRLEKALQESKEEAKRAKEESKRKLEIQQQEASNRFNALNIEHKMLKSKHDDLREELDTAKIQQRKAEEDRDQIQDQLRKNITSIVSAADSERQAAEAQIEYLKVQEEKGQLCGGNLQAMTRQLDQVMQEKSLQVTRGMELQQLLSNCDKNVDSLSNQVKTLELQLQQLNLQRAPLQHVPPNDPRLVGNNNQPQQNNILPGAPMEMDPYQQQKVAFDRQRQQDLLEQQYAKQDQKNIPRADQAQNGQQQVVINPGIQLQPLVVQQQQPKQQQPILGQQQPILGQQQPVQGHQQPIRQQPLLVQQQPIQQEPVAFNQNQQPQVPHNEDANEIKLNPKLHLDAPDKPPDEEKEESDYGEGKSDSDAPADAGVILKDPVDAARERPVAQGDKQAGDVAEDRLPDAVHDRVNVVRDGQDHRDEQDRNADDEPRWHQKNSQENIEEEEMQAKQEQQLEADLRREEAAEREEMGLDPPHPLEAKEGGDDGDEDAPGGLHLDVQRDEVEKNIEEEGFREKQQHQLQARAKAAHDGAGDEDSDYGNKDRNSDSVNGPQGRPLQRKFGVPLRGDNVADDHLGNDELVDRALDRPDINDDPMNEAADNVPVLEHPDQEIDADKDEAQYRFNKEMR